MITEHIDPVKAFLVKEGEELAKYYEAHPEQLISDLLNNEGEDD